MFKKTADLVADGTPNTNTVQHFQKESFLVAAACQTTTSCLLAAIYQLSSCSALATCGSVATLSTTRCTLESGKIKGVGCSLQTTLDLIRVQRLEGKTGSKAADFLII